MSTHVPYWNLRNKYSPPLQRWLTQSEAAEVYTEAEKSVRPAAPSANGALIDQRGGFRGGDDGLRERS